MTAAADLEALHAEIRAHHGCGFEPCETATHMVPGEGAADADVLLLGEAPGASEDEQGRPFVGRAGKLLDLLLAEASLDRGAVYITNVLKARPPKNRDPRPDEVAHSMPWLDRQLALIEPKLVVTLGRHALVHFVAGGKITQLHGQVVEAGERTLFPMYHPAAALRSRGLRETLFEDARRLPKALAAL
jgi:DNA polymerase